MRAPKIFYLLMAMAGVAWGPCAARGGTFTWTAGADVSAPLLNSEDADAGVVQDGPNLWVQTALYPNWHRYLGTGLDNLVEQAPPVRDSSFNQPNGDDAYWTGGIWQDATGKRYAIIHIEYDYAVPRAAFHWKRRIGLASSTDQGATWHYEGDILTTNPARSGAPSPANAYQDFGCGDMYLFVDRRGGYFYVFYMTAWVQQSTGWRSTQIMSVARCQIADKMAPGKWFKWSGGTWTAAGLGGAEDAVFSGTDSCVIHFNSYLNAFVAIGHDSDNRSWISTCNDITSQGWSVRDYTFPQRLLWYNWPVDPVTHDRYEMGQNFRLYSSQADVSSVATKYFPLSFSLNGNATPTASLVSPGEGTTSYVPGTISLTATAADSDGSVVMVEFLANQSVIGVSLAKPYVFSWANAAVGTYRLSVRATDNLGAATDSAGVDITVQTLTYAIWKSLHGIPAGTPDNAIQSNGLSPLESYALGIDNVAGLPRAQIVSGNLTLAYANLRSDVTYLVERSTNLIAWSSALVTQGTASSSGIVTASTPCQPNNVLFLRLKVTHP